MTGEVEKCPKCQSLNVKLIHPKKPQHRHYRCDECYHVFSGDAELDDRCNDCALGFMTVKCLESRFNFEHQCGINKEQSNQPNTPQPDDPTNKVSDSLYGKNELIAEKESKEMLATELKIEIVLENLIAGITEYDIIYGYSKKIPIPVLTHLENAKKEFQVMKYKVRMNKNIKGLKDFKLDEGS